MCGEKDKAAEKAQHLRGSPPRVRGKGNESAVGLVVQRITPACAGKSCPPQAPTFTRQDHPRVCGEKDKAAEKAQHLRGSPPRVRGKEAAQYCGHSSHWDHPRVCGEKYRPSARLLIFGGSPPRVRGKVSVRAAWRPYHGITPACAGKSRSQPRLPCTGRDHPRACGEKSSLFRTACSPMGSPPRVRGKAVHHKHRHSPGRITPACAGKSSIQHLTASLGEFEVQKGHPVPHLRQRLQVWPDHARHLRHGLILHASRSAGQGRRLCPGPCPDTADSGTPRGPSPAKRPHTSPPAATPGGCRAWQSGATAPGSQ